MRLTILLATAFYSKDMIPDTQYPGTAAALFFVVFPFLLDYSDLSKKANSCYVEGGHGDGAGLASGWSFAVV